VSDAVIKRESQLGAIRGSDGSWSLTGVRGLSGAIDVSVVDQCAVDDIISETNATDSCRCSHRFSDKLYDASIWFFQNYIF
jgi:hypothetical protein